MTATLSSEEIQELSRYAWRVSPMATGIHFSALEGENPRFEGPSHIKLVSDKIVDAVEGRGKKYLIVSMPPRHGKSTLVTRRTPQWYLARYPHREVGMCGYGSNFANEWGRKVRNEMTFHEDQLGFKLAQDSKKANWWHTDKGGGMWTAGITGEITGKGAHLLIIDDPIKNDQEAYSLTYRDSLWSWWQTTALSRTYQNSVIIVVMTRWHSDDFVGRLLSKDHPGDPNDWDVVELPAIWDKDVPDVLGRHKGDALWPAQYSAQFLIEKRQNTMAPEAWLSLFQQKPMNKTGVGACYVHFDEVSNVRPMFPDQENKKFVWSLDFNVNPMCSVIGQVRETSDFRTLLTNEKKLEIEILDEICLANSTTLEACQEFDARMIRLAKGKSVSIELHGDATGDRRDTRGLKSDWMIVKEYLKERGYRFTTKVKSKNPPVRDRVNAVNRALRSPDGTRSLFVHPKCSELRTDLQEVRWKRDASGNSTSLLDNSDPKRTHVSDALGYLVYDYFHFSPPAGARSESPR